MSKKNSLLSRFIIVALIILITLFISLFVIRINFVNGQSMENTLTNGQLTFIWQLNYSPTPGDIIVTKKNSDFGHYLCKRIIATEGQTVEIKNNTVYIDGAVLYEPYVKSSQWSSENIYIKIPDGFCFLLGDNRDYSIDSRNFGPVAYTEIMGKVIL